MLFNGLYLELMLEVSVGSERASDNHQSRRFLVQAMDNTRSFFRPDVLDFRKMEEQGIGQCPLPQPGSRMDDYSGGFIDDDDVFIVEDDWKWNIVGLEFLGPRNLEFNLDSFPHS